MQEQINALEQHLTQIKERNDRVEGDKAWETSRTRVGCICLITYVAAASLMFALGAKRPWLDGLIPVIGFFLSSRTLRLIKRWWLANVYHSAKH